MASSQVVNGIPTVCWTREVHEVDREFCALNPLNNEVPWYEDPQTQKFAVATATCLTGMLFKSPGVCLSAAQMLFWGEKK